MAVLTVFVIFCINNMMKKGHDLHAMAFFALLIYTVFAQIGYVYFPELSMVLNAYFGADLFYGYWTFLFLSFVLTYILYLYIFKRYLNRTYFTLIKRENSFLPNVFLSFYVMLLFCLIVYFIFHMNDIQYGDGNALGSLWFSLFFSLFSCLTILIYTQMRSKNIGENRKKIYKILFVIGIMLILNISFRAGARSSILYFFIGLVTFEFRPFYGMIARNKKKIFFFLLLSLLLIRILSGISYMRHDTNNITISGALKAQDSNDDSAWYLKFIFQDYYAPSHTLFIAMDGHINEFFDSFKSNFTNALFGFNYPLITQKIVSTVTDFEFSDRGIGYGFYLFTEGYYALGWLGIIYNALIWNIGMLFWVRFAQSDNEEFNNIVMALLASFIITLMRNQSSYFFKFAWMNVIPSFILLLFAMNYKIKFLKSKRIE